MSADSGFTAHIYPDRNMPTRVTAPTSNPLALAARG